MLPGGLPRSSRSGSLGRRCDFPRQALGRRGAHYSAPAVDIEEFYNADERRRRSPEVELGTDWRDGADVRHELSWVQDTGELYVMREPVPAAWEDPFGDMVVDKASVHDVTVSVLGYIHSHEELEEVMEGWQEAMGRPNGVAWIAERLRARSVPTARAAGPSAPPA